MKKPKKEAKEHHLAYQGNPLIESFYRVNLNAKKTMLYAIAQIQPNDKDFKYYMIDVDDFKELLGITGKKDYFKVLLESIRELRREEVSIYDEKTGKRFNAPLAVTAVDDPSENSIGFSFPPELKPHLLQLKKTGNFTKYRLGNVMKMRSVYSIRIYEILKKWENTKGKKCEYEIYELRRIVGVPEGKMERYYDFKRYVIEVAKKELPEKTDIGFTYKPIKQGRSVKWIRFYIKPRKKTFITDTSGQEHDCADIPSSTEIPAEIMKHVPEQYRTNHSVLRDITAYLKSHNDGYVVKNVAYAASKGPKDYGAYLGTCLKNNYGADYSPNQLQLFSDDKPSAPTIKLEPGMRVRYRYAVYQLDDSRSIRVNGEYIPDGHIIAGIQSGEIEITDEPPDEQPGKQPEPEPPKEALQAYQMALNKPTIADMARDENEGRQDRNQLFKLAFECKLKHKTGCMRTNDPDVCEACKAVGEL